MPDRASRRRWFYLLPSVSSPTPIATDEVQEAFSLAQLFLSLAERAKSELGRVIGHRMLGTVLFGQGKAVEAKAQFENSLELYSPERDAATTHQFGQNTEVHTKSSLSLVLFCLGDIDRALEVGADALRSADMLRHPHSTAIPLTYVGGWVFGLCDASDNLIYEAKRLLALSEQHRLTAFSGHGNGLLGWGLAHQGQLEKAAEHIERGVQILDSIEFRLALSGFLGLLADVRRQQGDLEAAEAACARAMDLIAASSFLWLEPELRRIEALILKETKGASRRGRSASSCRCVRPNPRLSGPGASLPGQPEAACLAPTVHDTEVEARLKQLSYLGNLAQRVAPCHERELGFDEGLRRAAVMKFTPDLDAIRLSEEAQGSTDARTHSAIPILRLDRFAERSTSSVWSMC